jgi:hypothetical protein
MSQHHPSMPNPAAQAPSVPPAAPAPGYQPAPAQYGQQPAFGGPSPVPTKKGRNVLGLIAMIVAIVGFVFACIPGALIVGWVLLPMGFILGIVSLFMRDKAKGMGIAALIIAVVGTIVGVVVFFAVAAAAFNDAFNESTSVVEPAEDEGASDEGAAPAADQEDAATGEEGTRDNPLPIGSTISSDEWTVTVDSHDADAADTVAGVMGGGVNDPAPDGSHYEMVTYTVTYTGEDSGYAAMVMVDLVTEGGNVVDSFDNPVLLDDSIGADELFNGASTTGSLAFTVPDGESALIRVQPGILADEMFFQP